jgi:hypothetical protein
MLDTSCSEVVWRVLATHCIRQFPFHYPSRASPCAITFQLDSTLPRVPLSSVLSGWHCFTSRWSHEFRSDYVQMKSRISERLHTDKVTNFGAITSRWSQEFRGDYVQMKSRISERLRPDEVRNFGSITSRWSHEFRSDYVQMKSRISERLRPDEVTNFGSITSRWSHEFRSD